MESWYLNHQVKVLEKMKVQEARNRVSNYAGEELYREACRLYQEETDSRIQLRSHAKPPSRGVIESVVAEMKPWMRQVGKDLHWSDYETLERIIEWETGRTWVRYKMTDPRVEEYGKRARLEISKGTPLPLLKALTPERLDAVSSMMLAQMQKEAEEYFAEHEGELEEEARKYFTDKEERQK